MKYIASQYVKSETPNCSIIKPKWLPNWLFKKLKLKPEWVRESFTFEVASDDEKEAIKISEKILRSWEKITECSMRPQIWGRQVERYIFVTPYMKANNIEPSGENILLYSE